MKQNQLTKVIALGLIVAMAIPLSASAGRHTRNVVAGTLVGLMVGAAMASDTVYVAPAPAPQPVYGYGYYAPPPPPPPAYYYGCPPPPRRPAPRYHRAPPPPPRYRRYR